MKHITPMHTRIIDLLRTMQPTTVMDLHAAYREKYGHNHRNDGPSPRSFRTKLSEMYKAGYLSRVSLSDGRNGSGRFEELFAYIVAE